MSPWISVSKELPRERGPYLVLRPALDGEGPIVSVEWFNTEHGFPQNHGARRHNPVSHWAYLPPPPDLELERAVEAYGGLDAEQRKAFAKKAGITTI